MNNINSISPDMPFDGNIMHSTLKKLLSLTPPEKEPAERSCINEAPGELESHSDKSKPIANEVEPLAPEALYGLAGDFVRIVEPHTEADPAALLGSFLIASGNYFARNTYYLADGSKHYPNEFLVVVGNSSKGRKGTSWNHVRRVLEIAHAVYAKNNISSGLSSGEGVIWAVRDEPVEQQSIRHEEQVAGYEGVVTDAGVSDKRLLVVESEFCRVLKAMRRDTNTLSAVIRDAWDQGDLNILTKNNSVHASDAHISILAHITADELRRNLTDTETGNGFANRFLWFFAKRSKPLPFGGALADDALHTIAERLQSAAKASASVERLNFDDHAAREWERVYPALSEGSRGLLGAITSRSEAHAVRIALIYALLDASKAISIYHLRAALAVIDYSNRSALNIFGGQLGDSTADEIMRVLTESGDAGLTRNDLYQHFGRNKASSDIQRALNLLLREELARMEREPSGGGKPAERWYAIRAKSAHSGLGSAFNKT